MKTHFILTMGTSILSNYRRETGAKKNPPLSYPSILSTGGSLDRHDFPGPSMFCESFPDMAAILRSRDAEGAEQSTIRSVMTIRDLAAADCRFHIIATDTTTCLFCAAFLGHDVLSGADVIFHLPAGLGKAESDRFSQKGLPNLLACVADILDQVDVAGDEAVIIPTGGYKIMVPYLTIASILYKRPAYYIFEGSREPMELPAPPLGINTSEFRSVMVLLENAIGLNLNQADPYFNALPKSYQHLVHLTETGVLQYTAFGQRLRRMYLGQTTTSPLRVRAEGNSLIRFLGQHRKTFTDIARLGETIWLGDKAPEMADHARHHHTNLFAYTELILLPILMRDSGFLSADELFLLLGMVYLHDCGHSLCTIPLPAGDEIPLLPTEIRNFHNLLGFIRLRSVFFLDTLKRQGLCMAPRVLDAIGWISAYHRKKMPLLNGEAIVPGGYRFGPISEKADLQFGGATIDGSRLALLVSLFRIIDGMDKQIGRAGDAIEISMRAEAILADLPDLHGRVRRMGTIVDRSMSVRAKAVTTTLLDQIVGEYGLKERVTMTSPSGTGAVPCSGCRDAACGFEVESPGKFSEIPIYQNLEAVLSEIGEVDALPLAWEYLTARVRLFFQMLQPVYYYSDLLLGMPRVTHSIHNGIRCIAIHYPENEDIAGSRKKMIRVWEEIRKWAGANLPETAPERQVLNAILATPEQVVAGIRDEYCSRKYSEVAAVLKTSGIIVQFQYKGYPVPCWQIRLP